MAFFKFRTAGESSGAQRQPESIEAIRRRARHRLIGATVLVLAGVVGFPLLFDTQPRPIPVDIPIDIPDRNKVKPLPVPARAADPVAAGKVSAAPPVPASAAAAASAPAPVAKAEAPAPKPATDSAKPAPTAKAETAAPARTEAKPEASAAAKAPADDNGSKAQALLDGKPAKQVAAEGRFVVQVGAFADNAKAREARLRLEHAGLKTYTQVADTANGRRIRVRVGPFTTRADADKAARKIKTLDLPAAILTL